VVARSLAAPIRRSSLDPLGHDNVVVDPALLAIDTATIIVASQSAGPDLGLPLKSVGQTQDLLSSESETEGQFDPVQFDDNSDKPTQEDLYNTDAPDQYGRQLYPKEVANKGERRNIMWSLEMEKGLFNELLEQANNGKRADNSFKKEAWEAACKAVWAITT
jgi:hypothetical protein